MMLTYKYRIYPTKEQENILNKILWIACWLYNKALEHREKNWRESRRSISCYDQGALWRDWRNEEPEENPLRLLNMDAGRGVLRKLDGAYRAFFKSIRGRPRFKASRRYDSVAYKYGNGSKVRKNRLYIQNVGLIKVRWHSVMAWWSTACGRLKRRCGSCEYCNELWHVKRKAATAAGRQSSKWPDYMNGSPTSAGTSGTR